MARVTGLEPAAFRVTGGRSNQLSYTRAGCRARTIGIKNCFVNQEPLLTLFPQFSGILVGCW